MSRPLPQALIDRFEAAGFARVDLPVLQPAEPFLDVMGEELRQRMFLTLDAAGRELCLRPDFTIPTALLHLAGGEAGRAAAYSYAGPVFRHGANGGEVAQIGVESFGRPDRLAAETEVLGLALEAATALGLRTPEIRLGDRALVEAAVNAVDAPASLRRRIKREIAFGGSLDCLADNTKVDAEHAGLFAALEAAGPETARGVIEDVLSLAGIATVGGRTPAEIAERFIERSAARSAVVSPAQRQALKTFLAIDAPAPEASAHVRALLGGSEAADAFDRRIAAFAAAGLPVDAMRFSAGAGQGFDYYDGLVFELSRPGDGEPLGGGGRYDGLLKALGAKQPAPGVGFALWPDRFEETTR